MWLQVLPVELRIFFMKGSATSATRELQRLSTVSLEGFWNTCTRQEARGQRQEAHDAGELRL